MFSTLSAPGKLVVVIGGYVAALLLALTAVSLNAAFVPEAERQASSGMYAFGDVLVFILVFCPLALVPTWLAVSLAWSLIKR